jgi:hypothetical protein
MATQADIVRGRDMETRIQFNGSPWNVLVRELTVEEIGEVHADDVNGEDQARPMATIDGYMVTCDCYEDGNANILENYIAYRQNAWTRLPKGAAKGDLPIYAGIRFNWRRIGQGPSAAPASAFVFGGIMALAPMKLHATRKESIMHTVAFRCQTFTTTRAA